MAFFSSVVTFDVPLPVGRCIPNVEADQVAAGAGVNVHCKDLRGILEAFIFARLA